MAEEGKQKWIPLESNPEIINKYIQKLGVPSSWQYVDMYGLDDELLAMVPTPVVAVCLLYPLTEKALSKDYGEVKGDSGMYFMKQTIGNACGTVALIHALANNEGTITFESDKHFVKYLEATKSMSPDDKAKYLEKDEEMHSSHADSAQEGATKAELDKKLNPHFITFVHKDGVLYELDGRKDGAISHGSSSTETFLKDTATVVKKFMERDPENLNFNLMALVQES